MPKDLHYGELKMENQRNLKDDEPVFVLAAHDPLALSMLNVYWTLVNTRGAPIQQAELVQLDIDAFTDWQAVNGTREASVQ